MKKVFGILGAIALAAIAGLVLLFVGSLALGILFGEPSTNRESASQLHQQTIEMADGKVVATGQYVDASTPPLHQQTIEMADGSIVATNRYVSADEQAKSTAKKINWPPQGFIPDEHAQLIDEDGQPVIRVEHNGKEPLTVQLLEIDSPNITSNTYAIQMKMRYKQQVDNSYVCLQMWNHLPNKSHYQLRVLSSASTHATITKDSDWRRLEVQFDRNPSNDPVRLALNLVMKRGGVVDIAGIEFVALPDQHTVLAHAATASPGPPISPYWRGYNWRGIFLIAVPIALLVLGFGLLLIILLLVALAKSKSHAAMVCTLILELWLAVVGLVLSILGPLILVGLPMFLAAVTLIVIASVKLHRKRNALPDNDPDSELRKMQAMDVS